MQYSLRRKASWLFLAMISVFTFISCGEDPILEEPKPETVSFERLMNFNWTRVDVGKLAVIGDRLYYSNVLTPGYFKGGEQHQFSMRVFDMRFGHAFSDAFTIGVSDNRRSLIVLPNFGYADNYVSFLNSGNIPSLPLDYLLNPGWSENPNFGLNGNYLLSSWESGTTSGTMDPVFIMELNLDSNPGSPENLILNRNQPVSKIIPLNFEVDGRKVWELISVFPFEEGWLASLDIAGLQISVQISKDGRVQPLFEKLERFVLYGVEKLPSGELFISNEEGMFYSPSGSPFELVQFARTNRDFRFKFIEDRLVVWVGDDQLFEVENYRTPAELKLVALENKGLEGFQVKDVALFEGKMYVSSNGGLMVKNEADFWVEKLVKSDPSVGIGWEVPN